MDGAKSSRAPRSNVVTHVIKTSGLCTVESVTVKVPPKTRGPARHCQRAEVAKRFAIEPEQASLGRPPSSPRARAAKVSVPPARQRVFSAGPQRTVFNGAQAGPGDIYRGIPTENVRPAVPKPPGTGTRPQTAASPRRSGKSVPLLNLSCISDDRQDFSGLTPLQQENERLMTDRMGELDDIAEGARRSIRELVLNRPPDVFGVSHHVVEKRPASAGARKMTLRERMADVNLPSIYVTGSVGAQSARGVGHEIETPPATGWLTQREKERDPEKEKVWAERRRQYMEMKRARQLEAEEEARRLAAAESSESSLDYSSDEEAFASDDDLDLAREGGRMRSLQYGVRLNKKRGEATGLRERDKKTGALNGEDPATEAWTKALSELGGLGKKRRGFAAGGLPATAVAVGAAGDNAESSSRDGSPVHQRPGSRGPSSPDLIPTAPASAAGLRGRRRPTPLGEPPGAKARWQGMWAQVRLGSPATAVDSGGDPQMPRSVRLRVESHVALKQGAASADARPMETFPSDGLPPRALLFTQQLGESLMDLFVESRLVQHEAGREEKAAREAAARRRAGRASDKGDEGAGKADRGGGGRVDGSTRDRAAAGDGGGTRRGLFGEVEKRGQDVSTYGAALCGMEGWEVGATMSLAQLFFETLAGRPDYEEVTLLQEARDLCGGKGSGAAHKLCQAASNAAQTTKLLVRTSDEGELNLSYCNISNWDCGPLATRLVLSPVVRNINLTGNTIDDRGCSLLAFALRSRTFVQVLNLSKNAITWRGAAALAQLLDCRTLDEEMVNGACALDEIHLEHCPVGDRGCVLLAEALFHNRTLKRINMRNCGISNAGAAAVGEMLVENSTLQSLLLGWNNVQGPGAKSLAYGVKFNPGLEEMDLSNNGLGDVGATHVGFALIDNARLVKVDLSRNHVGSAACMVLAEAISKNTVLRQLELNDNPLGAACVRIFEAMVVNDSLEKVGLQGSNFHTHANASVQFNPKSPNGHYTLSLDEPFHNQVAKELVRLRDKHGKESWRNVRLNGEPFQLHDRLSWPERMPEVGLLELTFLAEEAPPDGVLAMAEMDFENVITQMVDLRADDMWRIALLRMVSTSYYFTARQGAKLLGSFQWEAGRREACVIIFGRVLDTENIHVLTEPLSADETKALYRTLGIHSFFHASNPAGSYSLLLSKQVDRLVASRLLEAATKEGLYRTDPFKCNWRHVTLDGRPVDDIHLDTFTLPRSGTLCLEYMVFQPPPRHTEPADAFTFSKLVRFLTAIAQMEVDRVKEKLQLEVQGGVIGVLRMRRASVRPQTVAGGRWRTTLRMRKEGIRPGVMEGEEEAGAGSREGREVPEGGGDAAAALLASESPGSLNFRATDEELLEEIVQEELAGEETAEMRELREGMARLDGPEYDASSSAPGSPAGSGRGSPGPGTPRTPRTTRVSGSSAAAGPFGGGAVPDIIGELNSEVERSRAGMGRGGGSTATSARTSDEFAGVGRAGEGSRPSMAVRVTWGRDSAEQSPRIDAARAPSDGSGAAAVAAVADGKGATGGEKKKVKKKKKEAEGKAAKGRAGKKGKKGKKAEPGGGEQAAKVDGSKDSQGPARPGWSDRSAALDGGGGSRGSGPGSPPHSEDHPRKAARPPRSTMDVLSNMEFDPSVTVDVVSSGSTPPPPPRPSSDSLPGQIPGGSEVVLDTIPMRGSSAGGIQQPQVSRTRSKRQQQPAASPAIDSEHHHKIGSMLGQLSEQQKWQKQVGMRVTDSSDGASGAPRGRRKWMKAGERVQGLNYISAGLAELYDEDMPSANTLEVVRSFSTKYYVSVSQLLKLLPYFPDSRRKVDMLHAVFPRLVDPSHFPLCMKRLRREEQVQICRRVGYYSAVPLGSRRRIFHIHKLTFHLRLGVDEEKSIAQQLARIAVKVRTEVIMQAGQARASWRNLHICGRPVQVPEDQYLWNTVVNMCQNRAAATEEAGTVAAMGTVSFSLNLPSFWVQGTAATIIQAAYRASRLRSGYLEMRRAELGAVTPHAVLDQGSNWAVRDARRKFRGSDFYLTHVAPLSPPA